MNRAGRTTSRAIWIVILILLSFILVPFALVMMVLGSFIDTWGGSGAQTSAALGFGFAPLVILGFITWLFFKRFSRADRRELDQQIYADDKIGVSINEKKIVRIMDHSGPVTLEQVVTGTGLPKEVAMDSLRSLILQRIVVQDILPEGTFFRLVANGDGEEGI